MAFLLVISPFSAISSLGGQYIAQAEESPVMVSEGSDVGDKINSAGTELAEEGKKKGSEFFDSLWAEIKGVWNNKVWPWIVGHPLLAIAVLIVFIVLKKAL